MVIDDKYLLTAHCMQGNVQKANYFLGTYSVLGSHHNMKQQRLVQNI